MEDYPLGLYSNWMHDFVMRELEIGTRAAMHEGGEACGFGPLFDLSYELYCKEQELEEAAFIRDRYWKSP